MFPLFSDKDWTCWGRPSVDPSHFVLCVFCDPHCSCPNDPVTSNTAPANPHATGVAVYPALFLFAWYILQTYSFSATCKQLVKELWSFIYLSLCMSECRFVHRFLLFKCLSHQSSSHELIGAKLTISAPTQTHFYFCGNCSLNLEPFSRSSHFKKALHWVTIELSLDSCL